MRTLCTGGPSVFLLLGCSILNKFSINQQFVDKILLKLTISEIFNYIINDLHSVGKKIKAHLEFIFLIISYG